MRLSGKDLAEKIGCARSTLSEATKKGHRVKGRYDVQAWAEFGPSGRVRGYDVPEEAAFLSGERENPSPNEPNSGGDSAPSAVGGDSAPSATAPSPSLDLLDINEMVEEKEETTRKVAEESGDRTQLVSDETNVEGTARNAGVAYATGKAIENDTPGSRAFWTIGSGLAGGFGGYAVSEGNPWVAALGALAFGGVGYFAYGQQPRRQEGSTRQRDQRSGHSTERNGDMAGRRSNGARPKYVSCVRQNLG